MSKGDGSVLPTHMATLGDDKGGSESGRLYNPYGDLYPNLDSKSLQGLYKLPDKPEYLFKEEATVHRRTFGDNLTFYTGMGYLGGATVGGARGIVEGFRAWEPSDTAKLRVNRVLNGAGHRGRTLGNACGVVGLLYSGIEGTACHYRGQDDMWNAVIGGLSTGALYKAAAGPRSAAIASALGGIAAVSWAAARQVGKRYQVIL